jgi:hypothetical protein
MLTGGKERRQAFARLGSKPSLTKSDRVKAKSERPVADQITGGG